MRYEGTIYRPPGEWKSWLLQATVGCSHNACTFCNMYKGKRFRVRTMEEILEDIAMAKQYYGDLRRVFLCDGDAISMNTEDLLKILDTLYRTFPSLEKVTTYAGPISTLKKTREELKALRQAGLARAYLGVETGSGELLAAIRKGVDAEQMLRAGVMLREAGMDLWVMVLIGLAGRGEPSRRHAVETAEMMNIMRPRHLSALTYTPVPDTPMYDDIQAGRFQPVTPREALEETRTLLEYLQVEPLHFTSDHPSNYVTLKGSLPEDRGAMLAQIDGALRGERPIRSERSRVL